MNRSRLPLLIIALFLVLGGKAAAQRPVYDRGYDESRPMAIIAPKGSWMIGGNFGVTSSAQDNYKFMVVSGITSRSHAVNVSPQVCWMFADNLGIGLRAKYSRGYLGLDSASAGFGEISLDVKNYTYLRQKYLGAAFFRYYRPLGRSGRFAAFADAEVAVGGSQTKVQDARSEDVRGSFDTGFSATIGVNTGVMAYITKHLALDLRVGLLEFGYTRSDQVHNQVQGGGSSGMAANFMVDLLQLSVGLSYYINNGRR
ncbi:MAG: hypothetical protein IJS62_01610 [Bacteroidales bacterium]|nr:hypothetical protein [Bacteroidales bacterium]